MPITIVKWSLIGLALLALTAALVPLAVTWVENRQARDLQGREAYSLPAQVQSRIAVVFFLLSGNAALATRHIANRLGAELYEITARAYALGLKDWVSAMQDARGPQADTSQRTLDLAHIDTLYLGSPIWLYSPAPPIWAFVERNRFDGQRVVLFNTFNSAFSEEQINAFRVLNALDEPGLRTVAWAFS